MTETFTFTRRAANAAAYSDRTAKVGTLTGTPQQAVAKALRLAGQRGDEITIRAASGIGRVSFTTMAGCCDPAERGQRFVSLRLPPAWTSALVGEG